MPISSYTVLKVLGYGGEQYEIHAAEEAVAPFNLFAFVLHDPANHLEINQRLSADFDRLDYITGSKLLFFALVDPPDDWLSHAQHRSYHRQLTSWEAKALSDPRNAALSPDKSITAFSLANSLGIPVEMLPCIVVTDSFRSKRFIWVRTCVEYIEQQLQYLGYVAERFSEHHQVTDSSAILATIQRDNLNLCSGQDTEVVNEELAQILSDLLSFVAVHDRDSRVRGVAAKQAQNTIAKLYAEVDRVKRLGIKTDAQKLDRICLNLVSFLAQLNKTTDTSLGDWLPVNQDLLEPECVHILKTAYKVLDLLETEQDRLTDAILEETIDWTPGVICLSKVFEKEVNLSVVHWMRKELGVSLPAFFCKYEPGISASWDKADFNKVDHRGDWLPPGLGQSEHVCREFSRKKLPTSWTQTEWNSLLSKWSKIREQRNRAAHTQLIDEGAAIVVRDSLAALAKEQAFEKFYRMKQEYRGVLTNI